MKWFALPSPRREAISFLGPPHEENSAAIRVCEKAGFTQITGKSPWSRHMAMTLAREGQ